MVSPIVPQIGDMIGDIGHSFGIEYLKSLVRVGRRSARADESDGLENRCGRKATVGSNPTSSAQTPFAAGDRSQPQQLPTAET